MDVTTNIADQLNVNQIGEREKKIKIINTNGITRLANNASNILIRFGADTKKKSNKQTNKQHVHRYDSHRLAIVQHT